MIIIIEISVVINRPGCYSALLLTVVKNLWLHGLTIFIECEFFRHDIRQWAVRYALRHALAALGVFIATSVIVNIDPFFFFAAMSLRVEIRHIAERMLWIVCQCRLVADWRHGKHSYISAIHLVVFFLSQVMARVYITLLFLNLSRCSILGSWLLVLTFKSRARCLCKLYSFRSQLLKLKLFLRVFFSLLWCALWYHLWISFIEALLHVGRSVLYGK